ncbi:hypothetical protein [Peribacillus glennii]|uniref:Uncharacterized protein n=1 Tax=Peribacillus glennii TaxID=2303991 RepID=A0A372LHE1_9BACI|nr:hypothetical protein [Peribacillus glennii]RFU65372.1 hypothetical protein D0466_05625 [Peribacillus glennii]
MDAGVVKDIFENSGYEFLYEKFNYQFYISGLFDKIENSRILESFLDHYSFDENERNLFDDFAFHFRIFHNLYEKNSLFNEGPCH